MSFFQAMVLGIIQGLTEFLPISSTGHLRVVPEFFGWQDPGAAFTAVTQLGTMAAVLHYFRNDLWKISKGFLAGLRNEAQRTTEEFRLGSYILIGTLPICVFGFIFRHQIETVARSLSLIGTTLIVLGLVLLVAERVGKRTRTINSFRLRDGIVIGFAQACALVPGVSRSGATITAGLFLNFKREDAARYSFLLSVPAVVLSGLFELKGIGGDSHVSLWATLVATVFAFIVGWLSIAWLLKFLGSHSTMVFIVYRIILGATVLLFLA